MLFAKMVRSQEKWVSRGEEMGNGALRVGHSKTEIADGQPSENGYHQYLDQWLLTLATQ